MDNTTNINAFVLDNATEGEPFASAFLASSDFEVGTLKRICKDLGLTVSHPKSELVSKLARASDYTEAQHAIIRNMIRRRKRYVSIKSGKVSSFPVCADPAELVLTRGEEKWYGPVIFEGDEDVSWYIHPIFVKHWRPATKKASVEIEGFEVGPQKVTVRWLCFARVERTGISLIWGGFTHADSIEQMEKSNTNFPYWRHVPSLFDSIERLTQADLTYANLYDLVLNTMWDKYCYDTDWFKWEHNRIHAESGGLSLNASASRRSRMGRELDVRGVKRLANVIRRSVAMELSDEFKVELPKPKHFDDVILKTIIKDFGALSYEFALTNDKNELLFHGHSFFGVKPEHNSPLSFPHVLLYINFKDNLPQIKFLLEHLNGQNRTAS